MPPHNKSPKAWAILFDADSLEVSIFSFEYDYLTASQKIISSSLGNQYAKSLQTGIWVSDDILPRSEKKTIDIKEENIFIKNI